MVRLLRWSGPEVLLYLLISQVCILGLPSFGRAVTGTAADREMEVLNCLFHKYAYYCLLEGL